MTVLRENSTTEWRVNELREFDNLPTGYPYREKDPGVKGWQMNLKKLQARQLYREKSQAMSGQPYREKSPAVGERHMNLENLPAG